MKSTSRSRSFLYQGEIEEEVGVEVDVEVAEKSVLIKGLIEDGGTDDEIPIAQVNKRIMEKVIVFMDHMR